MFFNPNTKELFTDEGVFIKELKCPFDLLNWDEFNIIDSKSRSCSKCSHSVIDTTKISENSLLTIMQENPNQCLKIDLTSINIIHEF